MSAHNLDTKKQSQEFYLDSQYASVNLNKGKNSDVYFFLSVPVVIGNDHDIVLRLDNFVCPISWFLCSSSNQTLVVSGVSYQITEGNYNALTLKNQLNNILTGFSVTYDSATNKFTFVRGSPFSFDAQSTCFKLLGFEEGVNHTATQVGQVYTLTSNYIINLSGSSLLYVDLPNLSTKNVSAKNSCGFTTIVKSIVADAPYGSILSYVNNTNSAIVLGEKYISYFRVRLLDDDYNLLDLQGQHFTCTIELFFYYNGKPPGFTGNLTDVVQEQEILKKSLESSF